MASFQKTLQKFFVYFFTGVSVFLVILGITRIKKGEPIAEANATEQKGSSRTGRELALRGDTVTSFKGKTYQTPWGNLAVAIQVKDGKVTAVTIPTLPVSPPSQEAKAYLIEQAIRSGNANIQGVSGATITSMAFKASLESALSQARNSASAHATNNTGVADTSAALPTHGAEPKVSIAPQAKVGVSGTFTGNPYQTPWGNAVASVTITNGKIIGVAMPTIPNSPPSQYAEPYLVQQALAAGSANIQGVSGATYASLAFKSSLESAIAKANATATAEGQSAVVTMTAPQTTISTPATATSIPRRYRGDDDEWDD